MVGTSANSDVTSISFSMWFVRSRDQQSCTEAGPRQLQRPQLRAWRGARGELGIAGHVGDHRHAGARLGQHSATHERCLEQGPLPALNFGRLVIWLQQHHAVGRGVFGVGGEAEGRRQA
eukprot:5532742-Prymnesium_polylepis.1